MKIVFIGASKFGARCFLELLSIPDVDVVGCITAPQTFSISYNKAGVTNVLHSDMSTLAAEHDIPCLTLQGKMSDPSLFSFVEKLKPNAFVVAGWYHMIPAQWLSFAPAYGLHASLLPDYSGGAPLVWAIINDEKRTGITFFEFANGVDNGPIVGQMETQITDADTIDTLYSRIEDLGLALIRNYMPALANGTAVAQIQDEARRRVFPQRSPADGEINWGQSARSIYNFIRAQTKPYPGAFFIFNGKKCTFWSARLTDYVELDAGELAFKGARLFIGAGDGDVEIMSLAVDGIDVSIQDAKGILMPMQEAMNV
jgi:methionyl-tRNA formyltransferase